MTVRGGGRQFAVLSTPHHRGPWTRSEGTENNNSAEEGVGVVIYNVFTIVMLVGRS